MTKAQAWALWVTLMFILATLTTWAWARRTIQTEKRIKILEQHCTCTTEPATPQRNTP